MSQMISDPQMGTILVPQGIDESPKIPKEEEIGKSFQLYI